MKNHQFAYALRGRIIWVSDQLFHIPVIHDLYRVHRIEDASNISEENCTEFIVEFFHKFNQAKAILRPLQEIEIEEVRLAHEKIKNYVKLSQYVNYSYQASLPIIFSDEADKIDILASSLIGPAPIESFEMKKHTEFVQKLITDKKHELKLRYLDLLAQIKNASNLEELQVVAYKIVFEGINVV